MKTGAGAKPALYWWRQGFVDQRACRHCVRRRDSKVPTAKRILPPLCQCAEGRQSPRQPILGTGLAALQVRVLANRVLKLAVGTFESRLRRRREEMLRQVLSAKFQPFRAASFAASGRVAPLLENISLSNYPSSKHCRVGFAIALPQSSCPWWNLSKPRFKPEPESPR
jgi:hypothetical protein